MADKHTHNAWCLPCVYYCLSTNTCDYILIEDKKRPCHGGNGCTERIFRKENNRSMKPKWNTEEGKRMWQEGLKDRQIAEHFGVASNTVTAHRIKYWEKKTDSDSGKESALESRTKTATAKARPKDTKSRTVRPDTQVPEDHKIDIYKVLEEATGKMQGIVAICTAEAILQLWNWTGREELLKARKAIDYLLGRMEKENAASDGANIESSKDK